MSDTAELIAKAYAMVSAPYPQTTAANKHIFGEYKSMVNQLATALEETIKDTAFTDIPKCICDGASHFTDEQNLTRHPFLKNPDCPAHSPASVPALPTRKQIAEAVFIADRDTPPWEDPFLAAADAILSLLANSKENPDADPSIPKAER